MAQQQSNASIELKGSLFTLSVLHLTDNNLANLSQALQLKTAQAPSFFLSAPVVVNIEKLEDEIIDFAALKQAVESSKFVLVGISGGSNEQKQQAKAQGLAVLSYSDKSYSDKQATPKVSADEKVVEKLVEVEKVVERVVEKEVVKAVYNEPKVVQATVRSGQQIYAKDTDLIIIGSVGHGAEIIADGNIHVYGTLRGKAIAGAQGDSKAKIFCQNIQADLVSICGNYMMSEALQQQVWQKPAVIQLQEEKLVINEL